MRLRHKSHPKTNLLPALVLCVVFSLPSFIGAARAADPLETGFHSPPASARPQTWWHWLNGNITRAGITADLEAMARIGVGGAQIFNVDQGIPAGPVRFMSPQWLDMVKYAASEADRLGLQLCIHNCAGWSSSGGPWNTPDHAMQFITTSEQSVTGPAHFAKALAQPPTRLASYHDIAVLAFRTPSAEAMSMRDAAPEVTTSVPILNAAQLVAARPSSLVALPAGAGNPAPWVQLTFAAPFRARGLRIMTGTGRNEGSGEIQISDDGAQFRQVRSIGLSREAGRAPGERFSFEPAAARYWRITFSHKVNLAQLQLSPELRIENIESKAGYVRADRLQGTTGGVAPDAAVARDSIIDLTAHLQPGGQLTWDVPAGNWTILRCGYTPTGATNEPAPPEGNGAEVDKLSREAVDAHWAGALSPVIKALGPLAGKSLNNVLVDSYEVGTQNWSPRFREDFRAHRGYDLVPWLPVTTGRVIQSLEASERFLWDLRRTVADLYAENYYGRLAELAHQNGLMFSAEPYGNGEFEDFQSGGRADIPMGEFWAGDAGAADSCKLAASISHIYGRPVAGAESFTAVPEHARWQNSPYSLKALGDIVYCSGINRFIFHRYAMQPWTDKAPGMTMGPWGIHFERTETWWEQAAAWMQYLTRCQYLLQEGHFVADVLSFCGEDGPNTLLRPAGLPVGYDFDGCNAEVLLKRLTVADGRLVLPGGMSYRVLTLPDTNAMTPTMLRKLMDLVRGGAVVLGPKPTHSPSLDGYPACDDTVQQLAKELWGDADGKTVTEHTYGAGRVIWGKPLPAVLTELGLKPDFQAASAAPGQVHFIHRAVGGTDVYFISSSSPHDLDAVGSFRVTGQQPEFWHPDTGVIEPCPVWQQVGDRTEVPLKFAPSGSVFVVFRSPAAGSHLVSISRQGPEPVGPKPPTLTIVKATYGVLSLTDAVDVTQQVQRLLAGGTRHISASNDLGGDPADNEVKQMRVDWLLNGVRGSQTVAEGATIDVPAGATVTRAIYGLVPEGDTIQDQTMDMTAALAALVKNGQLHVVSGNELAGRDPASMTPKQLSVEYTVEGVTKKVTLGENQPLDLPGDVAGTSLPPTYELSGTSAGRPTLVAWAPGQFILTGNSGTPRRLEVGALPQPLQLSGPWQVSFPPKLGAPPRTAFDRLISWPDSGDPGVKYFSGTAIYRITFRLPDGMLAANRRFALDLGNVQVIAEPSMNGHSLGILWKPPFRTDVTGLLRKGDNTLEVKVTNLWPNRMIGDEQFPEDVKYTGGGNIAEWPQWLLKNTPRPEPRRVTFSTWKHWKKDDALLPSGLIGPAMIDVGEQVMIPAG